MLLPASVVMEHITPFLAKLTLQRQSLLKPLLTLRQVNKCYKTYVDMYMVYTLRDRFHILQSQLSLRCHKLGVRLLYRSVYATKMSIDATKYAAKHQMCIYRCPNHPHERCKRQVKTNNMCTMHRLIMSMKGLHFPVLARATFLH